MLRHISCTSPDCGGLNAFGDQLVALLRGFARREPLAIYVGLNLAAYEPLLIMFGLVGAWLASHSSSGSA